MKTKKIGFGIFLLTIGVIWLMINFRVIEGISVINSLIALWPLILVVIGVNVIFKHIPYVRAVTWLLFLAAIISYSYFVDTRFVADDKGNTVITEKMDAETKYGEFRIGVGATKIGLDSHTQNLFDANVPSSIDSNVEYRNGKESAFVNLEKKNYSPFNFGGRGRTFNFHLNDSVVWDLKVDTGAVSGTLDMSKLKVKSFTLNMGAGSANLIFGNRNDMTEVTINAGVSSVDVTVPKSSGLKVKMDGGLNGSNLSKLDWEKQGDYYVSPNFDKSESKIDMEVKMGVSSFNIKLVD